MTRKRKPGRPPALTDEGKDEICKRIAEGESLRAICEDDWLPSWRTVLRTLDRDGEDAFRQQYARAREAQADHYADQTVEIADTCEPDQAEIAKARLRIDARKWKASKLAPKKYGDKLAVGGADDLPPVKTDATIDYESLPTEVLEALRNAGRTPGGD